MEPHNQNSKRYLFIDTCVIQAAGNKTKNKSEAVINSLKTLANDGFSLAISEFTLYENLHGLWGKEAMAAVDILKKYERKVVSDKVLILASVLGGLYHDAGYDKDRIKSGDKIIAATAILEAGFILTENHKDFPHPFFITQRSLPLIYKESHHNKTIDLAIYEPNWQLINRRVAEKETNN